MREKMKKESEKEMRDRIKNVMTRVIKNRDSCAKVKTVKWTDMLQQVSPLRIICESKSQILSDGSEWASANYPNWFIADHLRLLNNVMLAITTTNGQDKKGLWYCTKHREIASARHLSECLINQLIPIRHLTWDTNTIQQQMSIVHLGNYLINRKLINAKIPTQLAFCHFWAEVAVKLYKHLLINGMIELTEW
jgi:hypothetical protein